MAENKLLAWVKAQKQCYYPAYGCKKSKQGLCCWDCGERESCKMVCLNSPEKRKVELLRVDMLWHPERKYYVTYLDKTCNDNEIMTMLQQEKYRKAPWFEEV